MWEPCLAAMGVDRGETPLSGYAIANPTYPLTTF